MQRISILGTGAYGIALSKMFALNDCSILMWTKFEDECARISESRSNDEVLQGVYLDDNTRVTTNLKDACLFSSIIVIAIPSPFVRETLEEARPYLNDKILCVASKGLDNGQFMSEVLSSFVDKDKIVVISGPSFAIDMVDSVPTGLSIASRSDESIQKVTLALANKKLRLVATNDVLGVEICGSFKNVIAICSGILAGLTSNSSCNAMFLTEAIHDVKHLISYLGGNDRTILSYAGIGDILLTCTSIKSRNYKFGYMLATKNMNEVEEYLHHTTVEGLSTLISLNKVMHDKNIKIPLVEVLNNIISSHKNPRILLEYLMNKEIIRK